MAIRTDLAVELYENIESSVPQGVTINETDNLTTIEIKTDSASKAMGKPIGKYQTLKVDSFVNDTDLLDGRLIEFASVLKGLIPNNIDSVLVVGLGNSNITADALGPNTSKFVLSTRHLIGNLDEVGLDDLFSVSSIATGVLGDTGIESAEIIKGVVSEIHPNVVIVVDALAASSMDRLGNTVQFSNTGIFPGSGVGNHRHEISFKTLGVPVISVGIPTVVSTGIIANTGDSSIFVTPREIDKISQQGAKLIGMGINVCFQKNLSVEDLLALVG